MQDNPLISCENLTLAYGRDVVLSDVSLAVRKGDFLPFVGPNGAGKTTLLRAILGLVQPRGGRIRVPFDRQVAGYVPQHKAIDPIFPVTARRIVEMGLYPQIGWWRRPDKRHKEKVDEALEMFSIQDHAHKTFDRLSGGMKQKVMLARAFASGAEIFVMDEPTSELDAGAEHTVLRHLHQLTEERGKTVLLAHHGLNHMTRWSEYVCLVEHGTAQVMEVDELLQNARWIKALLEDEGGECPVMPD